MTTSEAISVATEEFVVADANGEFPPCTPAEQQAVRDALVDRLVADEFGEPQLLPVETPPNPARDLIDGLRKLANYLEGHPHAVMSHCTVQLDVFPCNGEAMLAMSRGTGIAEKRITDGWFYLTKRFGPRVSIDWNQSRAKICHRIVTGTRVEPAKPSKVIPAEPEKVVEIVEWRCPKSFLAETT